MMVGSYSGLRTVFHTLYRRKWFILGPALVAAGLTGALLSQLPSQYAATALIAVDAAAPRTEATAGVPGGLPDIAARAATEIEALQSASLATRVVDKLNLAADAEFATDGGPLSLAWTRSRDFVSRLLALGGFDALPDGTVDRRLRATAVLGERLTVAPRGQYSVISVSVRSVDRAKAKTIVDAITDFYVADKVEERLAAGRRAAAFFDNRLVELKQKADDAERAFVEFREKSGMVGRDGRGTASRTRDELTSQLNQARSQRAERESRLKALQRAQASPEARAGLTEVLANPVVSGLLLQEAEVARRVADLTQRYGDNYPRVGESKAELAQVQRRLTAEIAKVAVSLQGDAEAARSKEAQLQEQVERFEQQASDQGQMEGEFRKFERQAEATRQAYEETLKRSRDIQEQREFRQPDVRLLASASASSDPVFPRYVRSMYLLALAGLVVGLLWVWLLEYLDSGFRTGEPVQRLTGHPAIGMIPALPAASLRKRSPSGIVIDKPMSSYAEALRSTYTSALLASPDRTPKVIMITSSIPGEGKSTFACSLATLLAKSNPGKRIVVVDCDMRRSSVAGLLKAPETKGTIDEYLSRTKSIDQVLGHIKGSGLYFVPARSNTVNSAELLASNHMRALVEALAEQFDVVLLDTPPLMAVSDPRVVARLADYVMFLVRWERTHRTLAQNALSLLGDSSTPVGVVLSQVNVRRHARYGFNDHGTYYSKYRDYYVS